MSEIGVTLAAGSDEEFYQELTRLRRSLLDRVGW